MTEKLIAAMERRMTWTTGRSIMKTLGIDVGRGWANTIDKISTKKDVIDLGPLEDALVEHLMCGEKLTKLYPVGAEYRNRLVAHIGTQTTDDCAATNAFPLGMKDKDLAEADGSFKLIQIASNSDGIGLMYSSVYKFAKTEEIAFSEFEHPKEMKRRFTEVTGVKYERQELFHVIWLPHDRDYLEVRVDFPKGLRQDEVHSFHSQLKKIVNGWSIVKLNEPVDLFPAVRRFYEDQTDGHMFDITFATSTGAIKHERAFSKSGKRDQRKEAYHLAGKGAVADIAIYRISVEWPRVEGQVTFLPTITLAASAPSKGDGGGDPVITAVHVQKCARAGDYEWAIGRLQEQCHI